MKSKITAKEKRDALALLKILAIGEAEARAGQGIPMRKAFAMVRANARKTLTDRRD
jgi:hypothetical protein